MAGLNYNELIITFPDNDEADITEANIVSESMKLLQSICDEDHLKFGGCIASEFRIELLNTNERQFTQSLVDKWISVKLKHHAISNRAICPSSTLYPSNNLYPGYELDETTHYIFSGKIDSAKLSENDNNVRTIIAYDAMAVLYTTDTTNYVYQKLATNTFVLSEAISHCLSNNGKINIPEAAGSWRKIYREEFDRTGGGVIVTVVNFIIKNDYWEENTSTISCGELLKLCCEVLAAFGVIVPNSGKGSFKMITLKDDPIVYQYYEKLQLEEYVSTGYTDYLFLTQSIDSSGKTASAISGFPMATDEAVEKSYDFTKNIMIYEPSSGSDQSRTSTQFDRLIMTTSIGYRIAMNSATDSDPSANINKYLPACQFDSYRPLTATVEGIPEQIIGKPITIIANKTNPDGSYVEEGGQFVKEYINTYVFKRTLTGIQALTDEIEVKGQR